MAVEKRFGCGRRRRRPTARLDQHDVTVLQVALRATNPWPRVVATSDQQVLQAAGLDVECENHAEMSRTVSPPHAVRWLLGR